MLVTHHYNNWELVMRRRSTSKSEPLDKATTLLLGRTREALALMERGVTNKPVYEEEGPAGWKASVIIQPVVRREYKAFVQVVLHHDWIPLQNIFECLVSEGYRFDDTPVDSTMRRDGTYALNIYPKRK